MAPPALQAFVSQQGVVPASWLNQVDLATTEQTDTGAANAYVIQSAPVATQGQLVRFTPAHTNTGPSTLNGVTILGITGVALVGGELPTSGPVILQSTGTQWQLVASPTSSISGASLVIGVNVPGGNQGTGTVNDSGGYFVNGMPLTTILENTSPPTITTAETYVATPFQIPANALVVGNSFRITCYGQCTSTAVNAITPTIRFGPNGTVTDAAVASGVVSTSTTGAAGNGFKLEMIVTVTAVNAATGQLMVAGVIYNTANVGYLAGMMSIGAGLLTGSLNTVQASKLGFSIHTAAATTSLVFYQTLIERLF